MLTVIYCTRKTNPEHKEHLIKSSGLHKHIEVIEIINNGESLTKAYNRGLKQAKNKHVVFCHDDITIETKQWGNKLLKQFEKNPEYAIIGVAGSKNMPVSGQWWEKRNKMYGRVKHTHEGKTWLSAYSKDLGQEIEPVINVDGVFFAVDITKLETGFNESVEGFHFYDVTFCFENHLKSAKIGVSTLIRVNHQSIGKTNDQWEENRKNFCENFKDNLPITLPKILHKGEKLNVLIGCLNFSDYTGSELYVFELAKQLIKEGCDVSICSNIGMPLAAAANKLGIKMFSLQEPPGYKLGDGKWLLKTQTGDIPSVENNLYKISDVQFDIIHLNHKPITEHLLRLYTETPVICSIHSEVIALEEPVISEQIKKYIAIRPEIKNHLIDKFNINPELIDVIYNPIDSDRFKPTPNLSKKDKKRVLFVGTIDYLRKQMIEDLIITTKNNGDELWIVGKKNDTYLDDMIKNELHVQYYPPVSNIERYTNQCDETAGILLGRTTIEGWLCGKAGWIYNVDASGNILGKEMHQIPNDVEKFKSVNVVKEIMNNYISFL